MTRTEFLRHRTLSGENKSARRPIPQDWSTADAHASLPERRALGLKMIFENMPVHIDERELIVGTRTLYSAKSGNEDGHDTTEYSLNAHPTYINKKDVEYFGFDESFVTKTHFTPDYSIILKKGIGGIIGDARGGLDDENVNSHGVSFLKSVIIAYKGLAQLILRYAVLAEELASAQQDDILKSELLEIAEVCRNISHSPAENFREAVQLFWFAQLAAIVESFEFINYGRLDVLLSDYLQDTPADEAQQLIECLLLKMYDQVDIKTSYLGNYAAQLNITIGGLNRDGSSAVSPVTFMILSALDKTKLPEPEVAVRVHSSNPPEFLEKAAKLSAEGLNTLAYYNDDLFIESLMRSGISAQNAHDYGFGLCQDMTICGRADFTSSAGISLAHLLMEYIPTAYTAESYAEFIDGLKKLYTQRIQHMLTLYNRTAEAFYEFNRGNEDYYFEKLKEGEISRNLNGNSLMYPLPILSGLFHGCIESSTDITRQGCELKDKGVYLFNPAVFINSLVAIKKYVFDDQRYTLEQVYTACASDFEGRDGAIMKAVLWNAPKWGNDDDYSDGISKEILDFCCKEINKCEIPGGGHHLAGIHQPHPVPSGKGLMATPEGRGNGQPVPVTLTPEAGSAKKGATAILKSAAKLDHTEIKWNFCVMINYFASVFEGNDGYKVLVNLIKSYFAEGGLQHQPHIADVAKLRAAKVNPEEYKDLIVRLWGVSAHFVDLPAELQDELIARFE